MAPRGRPKKHKIEVKINEIDTNIPAVWTLPNGEGSLVLSNPSPIFHYSIVRKNRPVTIIRTLTHPNAAKLVAGPAGHPGKHSVSELDLYFGNKGQTSPLLGLLKESTNPDALIQAIQDNTSAYMKDYREDLVVFKLIAEDTGQVFFDAGDTLKQNPKPDVFIGVSVTLLGSDGLYENTYITSRSKV